MLVPPIWTNPCPRSPYAKMASAPSCASDNWTNGFPFRPYVPIPPEPAGVVAREHQPLAFSVVRADVAGLTVGGTGDRDETLTVAVEYNDPTGTFVGV